MRAVAAGGHRLGEAFSYSILFMMAAPFVTVGAVMAVVVRAFRKAGRS